MLQGTPTKGETPSKLEKKSGDKENQFLPVDEEIVQPISIVNESFSPESGTCQNQNELPTFKQLSDQAVNMSSEEQQKVSNDKYNCIAILDEEHEDEKWEERTTVITKNDHEEYVQAAEAILADIIADVKTPTRRFANSVLIRT